MLSTKTAEFIVSRRTWLASPPAPTTPGRCLEQEISDWQEWPGELERVLRLLALAGAEPSHRPRRLGGEVGVSDRAHTSGVSARRDLMKREKRCAQLEQNPEVPAGSDLLTQRLWHLIDCPAWPESRGESQGLSRPSDVTHSGGMRLRWPSWEVACMNKLSLSALLSWSLTSSETVRKPRTIFLYPKKGVGQIPWPVWDISEYNETKILLLYFSYLFVISPEPPRIHPKVLKVLKVLNYSVWCTLTAWTSLIPEERKGQNMFAIVQSGST